ncbi:MAG: DUF3800 domain-containing protein [Candidatus Levyibacteriota bacterium]|nr:MAG: DUF3800 domain-containing protein [Candidatus Levybacteria bacterium]
MNYYLFLDESGHHGLKIVDKQYPILLLCGCLIEKDYYNHEVTKQINNLKLKYFKTTEIILHSRDIRKWQKDFKILGDIKFRHKFYQDLDEIIKNIDFRIIATAVLKTELIKTYGPQANNPYDLSLTFIMERTVFLTDLLKCGQVEVVAEARGKKEDAQFHKQYQIILNNGSTFVSSDRFQDRFANIDFKRKSENILGTQLCDLVAYPLANYVLYPERENLAFRVVEPKMYRQFPTDDFLGYGLKIFP